LDERQRLGIESEWLFPLKSNPAEPLKPETLDSWAETFSRILQKPFYFHSLRHYFTSECLKNNLPASVVQEIVGWESADMVNLYDDRDADETLAKYFDENGIK
jgi:integrase